MVLWTLVFCCNIPFFSSNCVDLELLSLVLVWLRAHQSTYLFENYLFHWSFVLFFQPLVHEFQLWFFIIHFLLVSFFLVYSLFSRTFKCIVRLFTRYLLFSDLFTRYLLFFDSSKVPEVGEGGWSPVVTDPLSYCASKNKKQVHFIPEILVCCFHCVLC